MKSSSPLALACLICAALVGSHSPADEPQASADAESVWITSIAQRGDSTDFVAATANGLLLNEADVVGFSATNPDELTTLYKHPVAVWCVDSTADGGKIASVDYRGNLMVFDTTSGTEALHEKAFERWCRAMLIGPDNQRVVAGNEAGKVMVWDLAAGKVTESIELDGHEVTALSLSPDHSQLAASDGAGHVHLLKWPSLESIAEVKISDDTAWCVAHSQDGKHLFVGSEDRNLYRVEPKADAKPESVAKGKDWIFKIAVSPGGQVAAAEVSGRLHFPSLGGTDSMKADSGVWSLCWNGDQQLFAGTRKDGLAIAGRSWKWTEPVPPAPAQDEPEAKEADEATGEKEMTDEEKAAEAKAAAAKQEEEKKKAEEAKKAADAKKKADEEAAKKAEKRKQAQKEKKAAQEKAKEEQAKKDKPEDGDDKKDE